MSLTLTITDNANGGGFSAAVAGSDPAAANTVYALRIDGPAGLLAWFVAGSRVGDGAVAANLGSPGFYLFRVESLLAGSVSVSGVYQLLLTDGQDALADRIFDAFAARAALLSLPGVRRILVKDVPQVPEAELPCLVLTDFMKSESELGGTNQMDDTGYPVYAVFVDRGPLPKEQKRRRRKCRQLLRRAFRSQLLPGVDEVMDCRVEPDPIISASFNGDKVQRVESALLFRFICREPRGLGA
jgi:hypothetical protein